MYSVNQWESEDGPPGFDFFMDALQYLPEFHEEGSVLFIEVLSLAGYFMQTLNRRDAAFLYVGIAMRMAIALALHQESSDPNIDDIQKEHRRRLWWSVYSLDRILCAKSGFPITIMDNDIGVAAPSRLLGLEAEYCPATVLLHYTELSRILGRITRSIYGRGRKSGSSLMTTVQSIMSDLIAWHRNIPSQLRFDFTKLGRPLSRESVSTYLHFHQCINATARPLLFHVVQKRLKQGNQIRQTDWRQDLSPATVSVIETCITAARDSTTMMACAAQQNLVGKSLWKGVRGDTSDRAATYGYMDREHLVSAAIVLVMVNIALTPNSVDYEAMQLALNVLGSMAEKGNKYVETRLRLLQDLSSWVSHGPRVDNQFQSSATLDYTVENAPGLPSSLDTLAFGGQHNDFSFEDMFPTDGTADIEFWEEGYGNPGVDIDVTWEQFSEVARNVF